MPVVQIQVQLQELTVLFQVSILVSRSPTMNQFWTAGPVGNSDVKNEVTKL